MIVYKTPSTVAFHRRQQFHAAQKNPSETISDWFMRLQLFIDKCEFESVCDYMLIEKFISGLSDEDFEKISQVPTWTTEDLVLVVIGNPQIFKNVSRENQLQVNINDILSLQVKCETVNLQGDIAISDIENESINHEPNEDNAFKFINTDDDDDDVGLLIANNGKETQTMKRVRTDNSDRARRHIAMLKEKGRYEEYKRKKAKCAKERRMKNKQNEQYLPPELQLHLMNERRRATRERVKRWRDRKSQNCQELTTESLESDSKMLLQEMNTQDRLLTEEANIDEIPKKSEIITIVPESIGIRKRIQPKRITVSKRLIKRKSTYVRRKKQFECYMCLLAFKTMYELKGHLNIFHPVEKREFLNCPYCPKKTISRDVLSRHLKKNHGTIQTHKCPCCDEEFTKRGQLHDHLAVHPDYRPFICETCGKGFKTMNELNSHFRKHTGEKPFKCGVCNMLLVSRSSFKGHMLTHTGERPYPCNLCDKEFRQQSSLQKHLISIHHQGEKPFLCNTCNKRFASIYHLRIHQNVHSGDRPYNCHYCNSTFRQPSALKAHISRIHENERRIQKLNTENAISK